MAPRANWKGYLRLSLVSCPIQLFPATGEREKVSFNQINKKTGHRIRYRRVDDVTGEEVPSDQIVKGYEIAKGEYVPITEDELAAVALESAHVIDIDQFVPREEIDSLYYLRPYYIAPDGEAGTDAFAVIRDTIQQMKMVAIGRVVLTNREHVIALEARGGGMMGMLLRYPYEIRDAKDYFDDIARVKVTKDMMDMAKHIVEKKRGHFAPEKFEDHYEQALKDLIAKKSRGQKIQVPELQPSAKVIDLMEALRRSVRAEGGQGAASPAKKKARKPVAGQRELLLPIPGKKGAKEAPAKAARPAGRRKAS